MKPRTLLRRLADKTHTPGLPRMVMGLEPWPSNCMIWTGATTKGGSMLRMGRDYEGQAYKYMNTVIRHGRVLDQSAHRVIYALAHPELEVFALSSICGVELCVNPTHWRLRTSMAPPPEAFPDATYEPDAPWTYEDAEFQVEKYLSTKDVEQLLDIPPDLCTEVFTRIGKLHLMPVGLAGAPPQGL